MSCLAKALKCSLVIFLFWLNACGVKGDPIPPDRPTEIGRGRPTYKRATEGIRIQRSTPTTAEDEEEKDEEEDRE